jgi:hypothetical protein
MLALLGRIASNTGTAPDFGDGRYNLLFKIGDNTEDGGGGGSFPDQVAGLKLWFKANAIVGLVDGDPVSAWSDSSGNGLDVTGSSSTRPIYKANIANGKPAIHFDTFAEFIRPNVPYSSLAVPDVGTIFVLQKQPDPNVPSVTFNLGATVHNRINIHLAYLNTFYFDFGVYDSGRISGPQPSGWNTGYHVAVCRRSGNGGEIWVDGQLVATGQFGVTLDTTAVGPMRIGGDGGGGGINFVGEIAEFFVYNSALSTTDRQALEDYLGFKYHIAITH